MNHLWGRLVKVVSSPGLKEFFKIVGVAVLISVIYGIANDLFTAHVCVEYFTAFYPVTEVLKTPLVIGLVVGVGSTWWLGFILGSFVAMSARWGSWPVLTLRHLSRSFWILFLVSAAISTLTGVSAYCLAERGLFKLEEPVTFLIPKHKESAFFLVGFVHLSGYFCAFVGGIIIVCKTLIIRRRLAKSSSKTTIPC